MTYSKSLQRRGLPRRGISTVFASAFVVGGSVVAAAPANAVVVGVCTIKPNDPHPSTHKTGTINAVGTISCSLVMDELFIRVTLEKANGEKWSDDGKDFFNVKQLQDNAATSCSEGPASFRTRVSYALDSPPGVNPAYHANTIYSPWKYVVCGTALSDPTATTLGSGETVSIPFQD